MKKWLISLIADEKIKDYVRQERAEQKAADEVFYLEAQRALRKRYQKAFDKNGQDYIVKLKQKLSEARRKDLDTITELRNELKALKEQNDRYLQAVAVVAPFAHKMQIHYSKLVEESKETAMVENRRYAKISQENDQLETDIRLLSNVIPRLNNLLREDIPEVE